MTPIRVYVHHASVIRDGQRVAVPIGEYDVEEIGTEEYEFSQRGEPKFILTASDVGTYVRDKGIVIREGSLP